MKHKSTAENVNGYGIHFKTIKTGQFDSVSSFWDEQFIGSGDRK